MAYREKSEFLLIKKERCPADYRCPVIEKCPVKALFQEGVNPPDVDNDKCVGCRFCVRICPKGVFEFVDFELDD